MKTNPQTLHAPVSVIIPCFNQGQYLAEAIDSVLNQRYPNLEVIVIDDGSTDHTKDVAAGYDGVIYVRQTNQGLPAARNTGIMHSSGHYLVFLDADDWLLPGALEANLDQMLKNPQAGFVSGAHRKVNTAGDLLEEEPGCPDGHPFLALLQGNYIGMHGAVMYARWVFDSFRYDISLKACEDYDLYLRIVRKYPVLYHDQCLAVYRIHAAGMSANIPLMLTTVLEVLERQEIRSEEEARALSKGRSNWINYYCEKLYEQLRTRHCDGSKPAREALAVLRKYRKDLYTSYIRTNFTMNIRSFVKKNAPVSLVNRFRKNGGPKPRHRSGFRTQALRPYSTQFGYDRGGPLDRYYIENFLQKEAGHIRGRVLEIGDNAYTLHFGGQQVQQSDVLHVDENQPQATLTGDLSHAPHIPDNAFDCIVLTQTLHLIYHYQNALATCYRILKPGGRLLLTVPGISPIDHGEWESSWYWSFTSQSVTRMLSDVFQPQGVTVETHGNVLVASAFLYGLGLPELKKEQMDLKDPHYPVIITAVATKLPLS